MVIIERFLHRAGNPATYLLMDMDHQSKNSLPTKTVNGLSKCQITLGVSSFLCQIIIIVLLHNYPTNITNWAFTGDFFFVIASGVFFVIAGCFGLKACRKPSSCYISAFMILSILATLISAIQIFVAMWHIIPYHYQRSSSDPYLCRQGDHVLPCDPRKVEWGLFCFIILAAVVEVIVSTISVATCSKALCCKGGKVRRYNLDGVHMGYMSRSGLVNNPVAYFSPANTPAAYFSPANTPLAYLPPAIPNFGAKISNSVETAVFTNATFMSEK